MERRITASERARIDDLARAIAAGDISFDDAVAQLQAETGLDYDRAARAIAYAFRTRRYVEMERSLE